MPSETTVARSPAGPHVAVLAFPFGTHAAPLLALVRRLAASAPSARFSFFSTAQSNAAVISSSGGSGNLKSYDVADGVPEGNIELFVEAAPAAFREAVEAAVGEAGRGVSCIVGDAFLWFASEMAEEMGVPWVAFWAGGPTSLASHFYTDAIRHIFRGVGGDQSGGTAGQEDKTLQEFIPGMCEVKIRDLPEGVVFGNLESAFSKMLHKMGLALPRAAAVFINSFEELHPPTTTDLKSKLNNFLNVGPLNLHRGWSQQEEEEEPTPDPHACLLWLDKHRPASVVYVSFGSFVSPPQPELIALAEALEASRLPFLWSLRDNAKSRLPQGFPTAMGKVVPWAPQTEVLAHAAVGAFVTHCGWNSVLESMAGRVPMICRPFLGDQRLNGRMVESTWGTGVGVEGGAITKSGLMRTLDLVLSQEQGQRMRARNKKLKEVAEKAVGPHGSSAKNFEALSKIVFMQKNATT